MYCFYLIFSSFKIAEGPVQKTETTLVIPTIGHLTQGIVYTGVEKQWEGKRILSPC